METNGIAGSESFTSLVGESDAANGFGWHCSVADFPGSIGRNALSATAAWKRLHAHGEKAAFGTMMVYGNCMDRIFDAMRHVWKPCPVRKARLDILRDSLSWGVRVRV